MAKKYLKNLKESVLSVFYKYGRRIFIKITEIRDRIKEDEDFIWDSRVRDELADNYGLLTHITSSINQLRNEGVPIISSDIQGKGYTLAGDWNRNDIDKVWDDKFNANEKRKNIPKTEKEIDNKLFNALMEKITKAQFAGKDVEKVRKKLVAVAKKHKLKKEEKEEDES
jgi:hypothetical protein